MLGQSRIGRITSSEIVALMSNDKSGKNPGAPFYTYVEECKIERLYQTSIDSDVGTKAIQWGRLCEGYVASKNLDSTSQDFTGSKILELVEDGYNFIDQSTLLHRKYPDFWCGSPDNIDFDNYILDDDKCPSSLKTLYNLTFPLYDKHLNYIDIDGNEAIKLIRKKSKDGEKFYQQIVSNVCILESITNIKYKGRLNIFFPKYNTLYDIKAYYKSPDYMGDIIYSLEPDLVNFDQFPHLPNESKMKEYNSITFDIPDEDKIALEERVIQAIELINA